MSTLTKTMLAITILGAINWLLIGLFSWNFVAAIFGSMSAVSRIIYVIVGIAGLYCLSLYSSSWHSQRKRITTEAPRRAA
jgi:uncharacterized membrane protein YuzA (DUF378 family)